jgi:hypothetical protein
MASSAAVKSKFVTVVTAGTQVPLSATDIWVRKLYIRANSTNAGAVAIGDSTVDMTSGYVMAAGAVVELEFPDPDDVGKFLRFNLADIYVDAANNTEEVGLLYSEVS